jgi:hypothetical protein
MTLLTADFKSVILACLFSIFYIAGFYVLVWLISKGFDFLGDKYLEKK